jgi:hypothetical protein
MGPQSRESPSGIHFSEPENSARHKWALAFDASNRQRPPVACALWKLKTGLQGPVEREPFTSNARGPREN